MQLSFQTRLTLAPVVDQCFDAFGALFGSVERTLYADIARGRKAHDLKSFYCAEYGLSARQFNGLRIQLEGKISSTVELLKLRKTELKRHIDATKRFLKKLATSLETQSKAAKKARPSPAMIKQCVKWRDQVFNKTRRLESLQQKFDQVMVRLKAGVPGICFGSRKLFRQQFHLEKTDFGTGEAGHQNWRRAWRDARSHQFFLVGSGDETSGNQSCEARVVHAPPTTGVAPPATLTLQVKVPPALVRKGYPPFLTIEDVTFAYGHDQVLDALKNGTALSYRFHRDHHGADGWRVFVSTDVVDAPVRSMRRDFGILGIDFNADHLAWAITDRFGNTVQAGRVDLPLDGKSTGQRTAILSDAIDEVIVLARDHGVGISIEDLDFTKKKQELRTMGVERARMLSGLAYSAFRRLITAKASRTGVALHVVDPAWTSVAGAVKYATRQGRTVHQAAAGVIARRAQGYSEKRPRSGAHRVPLLGGTAELSLPDRNRDESPRAAWGAIRKCLTLQVRARKRLSSCHAKGQPGGAAPGSSHLLAGGGTTVSPVREPGTLLARRLPDFPDVPF
ncbi:MAG: transposase [Polaromonas sp.]|nr:transposase [Polaromonas sp.]